MALTPLTLALRRLRRQPGDAALNIAGLAVGLAGCLLIGLFAWAEGGVDRFHTEADRLVRVVQVTDDGGTARTGGAHAALLAASAAGVEVTARVAPDERTITVPESATTERAVFAEPDFAYADASFFDVFSFRLAAGDPATALAEPNAVVLTEAVARRYFGDADPMGRTVLMYDAYNEPNQVALTVTGVLAAPSGRSHLPLSVLASTVTLEGQYGPLTQFDWPGLYTYARLGAEADAARIEAEATQALAERVEGPAPALSLQPVTEIYLRPQPEGEPAAMGSQARVYGLATLALLVLLLACVNVANLAVARATAQIRASGIRRSVGALRSQLAAESLASTFVLIGLGLVVALGLVGAALPSAEAMVGQDLLATAHLGVRPVLLVLGLIVLAGVVAGGYPAWLIARQPPTLALRGQLIGGSGSARLRTGLLVAQFGCSMALLAGALVVQDQLRHVESLRLGFERDQVVAVEAKGARRAFEPVREAFAAVPGVEAVTASNGLPGVQEVRMPEVARLEGEETGGVPMHTQGVGPEFFETMGVRLVAGRLFDAQDLGDSVPFQRPDLPVVLNETAAAALGWSPEAALGRSFTVVEPGNEANSPGLRGTVSGVVADIHHGSARTRIPASTFYSARSADVPGLYVVSHVLVKLAPGASAETLDALQSAWHRVLPEHPFEAAFLDDQVQAQYETDLRLGQAMGLFAGLAVFVAGLGLFGLASFLLTRRTKEVGVRKSLGATSGQIAVLLSGDTLRLVAVAFVVAAPLAYLAAQRWLEGFVYRVDLGPGLFLIAGAAVGLVALAAVTVQTIAAATADPVHALRSE
ncbi:MAG: ABC transporter permease [Bacteroidota bacterium]